MTLRRSYKGATIKLVEVIKYVSLTSDSLEANYPCEVMEVLENIKKAWADSSVFSSDLRRILIKATEKLNVKNTFGENYIFEKIKLDDIALCIEMAIIEDVISYFTEEEKEDFAV